MSSDKNIQLMVRINGTLPDITTLGSEGLSERAAEVKNHDIISNTSCSIFSKSETNQIFHILVDVGQGIIQSIEKGNSDLGFEPTSTSTSSQYIPDVVLITHSHNDHIKELPILIEKAINNSKNLQVFWTIECYNQILKEFPQLSSHASENTNISFNMVQPNSTFNVNQFSITPILANHGDNYHLVGSVIYIIKTLNKKIIIGWDFLSLPDVDEHILWNPDFLS